MRTIQLSQGYLAEVDDEDYEYLSQYNWNIMKKGRMLYAARRNSKDPTLPTHIYMHRELMGFPESIVDHRDRNGLNCSKQNLRKATKSQNSCNVDKRPGSSSSLKGAYWHKGGKKWMSRIQINRIGIYLGLYCTEEEAHNAYCVAARRLHGEFAYTGELNK